MNVQLNANQSITDGHFEMCKQIIVSLCYFILTLHTVRVGRVEALKDDHSEQPLAIYLDAGNEIENVANNIASYGSKQDSMMETLKGVQKIMEKIEQRMVELESSFKTASDIEEIIKRFGQSLENRLSEIENKLSSADSRQESKYEIIEQRLDELWLNLRSALKSQKTNKKTDVIHDKTIPDWASILNMTGSKANLYQEETRPTLEQPLKPALFYDCAEAKQQLGSRFNSGIYTLYIPKSKSLNVYCQSDCDSCCPWTVVLQSSEESEESVYQRSWSAYKHGFGKAGMNFFIGLDRLHVLTKGTPQALLIRDYTTGNEKIFKEFSIKDEQYSYAVEKLVSLSEEPWRKFNGVSIGEGDPFSSDSVCAKSRGQSWWYNTVCVASLEKDTFSDRIFMGIRPQECQ